MIKKIGKLDQESYTYGVVIGSGLVVAFTIIFPGVASYSWILFVAFLVVHFLISTRNVKR